MFSAEASTFIGRIGALAIALGIGGAVATPSWVASADDSDPSSTPSSAASPRARDRAVANNTASTNTSPTSRASRPAAAQRNSHQRPSGSVPKLSVARVDLSSSSRAVPAPTPTTAPETPAIEASAPTVPAATASTAPVARTMPSRVVARPAAAVAATGQLSVPNPSPSGKSTSAPTGPLDFLTATLSLVSREINR
ncbi:MAG: hypothetical protein WCJ98_14455, partial [Mycobacteriaceae bacterium]